MSATKKSFSLGLVLTALLMTAACDTVRTAPDRGGETIDTKRVLPVPASRAGKGPGAVAIVLEMMNSNLPKDMICRWRVINTATKKSYFLNARVNNTLVYEKLDAGPYQLGRLGCGVGKVWDLDESFKAGFLVGDGQISYLGKINLEFKNGNLEVVRKGTRAESAQAFIQVADAVAGEGLPFISGFTGRPMDRAMVESLGENLEGFDVFGQGITQAEKSLAPLIDGLKLCAKEDSVTDPVRFGHIEYLAVYKQGRFSEMKDRRDNNAFSEKLRACVQREMMSYHPPVKTEVEVRVKY